MKEKFSDFEGSGFINQEGEFLFEIMEAELTDSKAGNPMWKLLAKSDEGQSSMYFSLNPKARWKLNNLIKACLRLDTKEKINNFMCDYETIGQELVGKKFIGVVECEVYEKEIKVPNDDGTFRNDVERRDSYKIDDYKMANAAK